MVVWHVDHGALQWFVRFAIDLTDDDLRSAHLDLVALPAHGLDENG